MRGAGRSSWRSSRITRRRRSTAWTSSRGGSIGSVRADGRRASSSSTLASTVRSRRHCLSHAADDALTASFVADSDAQWPYRDDALAFDVLSFDASDDSVLIAAQAIADQLRKAHAYTVRRRRGCAAEPAGHGDVHAEMRRLRQGSDGRESGARACVTTVADALIRQTPNRPVMRPSPSTRDDDAQFVWCTLSRPAS